MTKKELAKINKELQRIQKFYNWLDLYQKQLTAARGLLQVATQLAKKSLPYEVYTEHSQTLSTADKDFRLLEYEALSQQARLEEKRVELIALKSELAPEEEQGDKDE